MAKDSAKTKLTKKQDEKKDPKTKKMLRSDKSEKKEPAKKVAKTDGAKLKKTEQKAKQKSADAKKAVAESKNNVKAADAKAKAAAKAPAKKTVAKKAEEKPKKTVAEAEKFIDSDAAFDFEKTTAVKEGNANKNGKFDIRRAKDGRFFFSLYASNYTVIAYSQIYSSSSKAVVGINSVIANCPKAPIEDTTLKKSEKLPFPKWEIYIDNAGEYRFRLYATNGLCVCHSSHGYTTKSGCKGGIESIKRFSAEAVVDKSYLG